MCVKNLKKAGWLPSNECHEFVTAWLFIVPPCNGLSHPYTASHSYNQVTTALWPPHDTCAVVVHQEWWLFHHQIRQFRRCIKDTPKSKTSSKPWWKWQSFYQMLIVRVARNPKRKTESLLHVFQFWFAWRFWFAWHQKHSKQLWFSIVRGFPLLTHPLTKTLAPLGLFYQTHPTVRCKIHSCWDRCREMTPGRQVKEAWSGFWKALVCP